MESTAQVLYTKKKILGYAPYSGAKLKDKDVIFFVKEPGTDAFVYDDGTVIMRSGWGDTKKPTRFGGIMKAVDFLSKSGYKPYNLFYGNEYEKYESQHVQAKKEKISARSLFSPYESQRSSEGVYTPQFMDTPKRATQKQDRLGYGELLAQMPDYSRDLDVMTKGYASRILSENQFATFAGKEYGTVQKLEKQLGLNTIGTIMLDENDKKQPRKRKTIKRDNYVY